jgi:TonB family protein
MKPIPYWVVMATILCHFLDGGSLLASTPQSLSREFDTSRLSVREKNLFRLPVHSSEFSSEAQPLALPRCGNTRAPEALATPEPLLFKDQDMRVRVSFIVGADGRVYSPFILDSGGAADDQLVLQSIRRWRYRPALCNGVPTDAEARVQFSRR